MTALVTFIKDKQAVRTAFPYGAMVLHGQH